MDKTILITGAARRIGRALALALAADGWNIALHYHHAQDDAQSAAAEITAMGRKIILLNADLQDIDAVSSLIARANDELGRLNALINNASLFERDTAHHANSKTEPKTHMTPETWNRHIDINTRAPAFLMRDFAEQAQNGDAIINIIDQRVWRLTPDFISYTASKAALWTLTQTFAQSLAPHGIRVNAIGPGPTLPSSRQTPQDFKRQSQNVPLGHGATPQDIVDGARYLLAARAMTGQMLALDGGQHLAWQTPDISP